jgi:hypothetical protein
MNALARSAPPTILALSGALAVAACEPQDLSLPACEDGISIVEGRSMVTGDGMALDASNVYFAVSKVGAHMKEQAIVRVPKNVEEEVVLWHGTPWTFGAGLAVDDRVYFGATMDGGKSGVFALPKAGGDRVTLGTFPGACKLDAGIALDAERVFVASGTCAEGSFLASVPRAGGTPTTVWSTSAGSIHWIAVDAGRVFFVEGDMAATRLRSIAPDASDLETVATLGGTGGIGGASLAVHAGHAYVVLADSVVDVDVEDGAVTTLASNLYSPRSIVADDAGVYVSAVTSSGADRIFAIDPTRPNELATLAAPPGGAATELALDDASVYATTPGTGSSTGRCSGAP